MVLVTTSSLSGDLSIRSIAGPESTGCVEQAYTSAAPYSIRALAASTIVPAVSMISSTRIAVRPFISPIIFMTSDTLGSGRRLSIIARGADR
ncbi:hypothetical protein D3C73_1490180 [compost metagenome]